jgi:hypothetical protein
MFVLFNTLGGYKGVYTPQNYLPANWTDEEIWLNNTVENFTGNSQIYAWALENEANVFQQVVVNWYAHFIPYLRKLDNSTPITTSFYQLGPNSTTLSRSQDLVNMGLDFIELHYYPTNTTNIQEDVNAFTRYVTAPIFLSEFSVWNGTHTYSHAVNKAILQNTIVQFEARLNVIGLSYYRWSDDNDSYTVWNTTSQTPTPEGLALNRSISAGLNFLSPYPYAYLERIGSSDSPTQAKIYDPSFQQKIVWPNTRGWTSWRNHTACDYENISTGMRGLPVPTDVSLSNYDFENGTTYWTYVGNDTKYAVQSAITYHGSHALEMWANSDSMYSDDNQYQHDAIPVTANYAYILDGWINITSETGGAYAWLQIVFRNATGGWVHWSDENNSADYVNYTTGWVHYYAACIAPTNAVDMLVNCRVRGINGSITAYFDYLHLTEVPPTSYDGRSAMVAFGTGVNFNWSAVQLSQNYTFTNATYDVNKIWTFSVSLCSVESTEYVTDWKGVHVELAFTTANPNQWIDWFDGEYLSESTDWTTVNVSGTPPPNAKGIQLIIKASKIQWGVFYVDNAVLTSVPAVTPINYTVQGLSSGGSSYNLTLYLQANPQTNFKGYLYTGPMTIKSANCSFSDSTFWGTFPTVNIALAFNIPEFPTMVILPLFIILTSLAVVFAKKRCTEKMRP